MKFIVTGRGPMWTRLEKMAKQRGISLQSILRIVMAEWLIQQSQSNLEHNRGPRRSARARRLRKRRAKNRV